MASDDDYQFSVVDGCVILEIFGDSDEEDDADNNDSNHSNDKESSVHDNDDCNGDEPIVRIKEEPYDGNEYAAAESVMTNGYSSDASSLTVHSEITNKTSSAPPSRHSSLEQQMRLEDNVDLDMHVTEEKDLSEEYYQNQLEKENVLCIKPETEINNESSQEESLDDLSNDLYLPNNGDGDEDLIATKQALSLNELFKQYRKTPSAKNGDLQTHISSGDTSNRMTESQNINDLQTSTEDGITEYILQADTVHSSKVEVIQANSATVDVSVKSEITLTSEIEVAKPVKLYDRKRPNLRQLARVNMSEDSYFNELDEATRYKSKSKAFKSTVTTMATKLNAKIKKRQTTNVDRVQCDVCEGWFAGTQSLGIHMRIHNDEKPYACRVCGWRSRTSSAHSMHIKLHSQDKQYKCSVCNMKFYTSSMLKSHYRVHSGEKPYKCLYCTDSFAHSSTLKVHIRQHTKERPYVCAICDKRFAQPTHLTTHSRTHTNEKPFECKYCGKRMRQSSHLKIHLRIHTQERPYDCDECTANFMTKEHLVMHKRTHSGDHPYPCKICGEAFTQSSARKKHEKRHEEGAQHRCDICFISCISPRALKRHMKNHAFVSSKIAKVTRSIVKPPKKPEPIVEEEEEEEEEDETLEEEIVPKIEPPESPETAEADPIPAPTPHSRNNPLQCDVCFKVFARIPNVTRHKMEIHAGFKRSTWAHSFERSEFSKAYL